MIKGYTIHSHACSYCIVLSIGYLTNGLPSEAIRLFKEIKEPNEVNVTLLFNACAQLRTEEALGMVKAVSSNMSKTFHSNTQLLTSLLDALMQCGDVKAAERVFGKLTAKTQYTFGVMIKGYTILSHKSLLTAVLCLKDT